MTPQFITLPTGTRINTAHLIHYRQSEHAGQIHLVLTDEPTPWLETMTLAELDDLLQPQQAIVSPVLELRMAKEKDAVMFTYRGEQRHGIVSEVIVSTTHDEYSYFVISSGLRAFRYWPDSGDVQELDANGLDIP